MPAGSPCREKGERQQVHTKGCWVAVSKGAKDNSTDKKADMEGVALLSTVVLYVIHIYVLLHIMYICSMYI